MIPSTLTNASEILFGKKNTSTSVLLHLSPFSSLCDAHIKAQSKAQKMQILLNLASAVRSRIIGTLDENL